MKKVISPLRKGDSGAEVKNLQEVLHLLLEKGVITQPDTARLETMQQELDTEQAAQTCGSTTSKLLKKFQKQQGLKVSGRVDKATAVALNTLIPFLKIPDKKYPPSPLLVNGIVTREDGLPRLSKFRSNHITIPRFLDFPPD